MRTLIIVDIQNDFIPGGALAVPNGNRIIPVVNKIIHLFDLVVATQDWHPQNHKSFASNHEQKNPFEVIQLNGLQQTLWPDHCVQNTQGAELCKELDSHSIEAIFRKGMDPDIDSYSGFFDNGRKRTTGLAGFLKEKGATDLYFCGLAGDICVFYTLLDALKEGFSANFIEDASAPLDTENFDMIKEEIISKGGKIIRSEDI